jgi:hypothetical protein
MVNIKDIILSEMDKKNITKRQIYNYLEMTPMGFDKMLENDSISLKKFIKLSTYLGIDVSTIFDNYNKVLINEVQEPEGVYKKAEKNDCAEIIFQNTLLIKIIDKLTDKDK